MYYNVNKRETAEVFIFSEYTELSGMLNTQQTTHLKSELSWLIFIYDSMMQLLGSIYSASWHGKDCLSSDLTEKTDQIIYFFSELSEGFSQPEKSDTVKFCFYTECQSSTFQHSFTLPSFPH